MDGIEAISIGLDALTGAATGNSVKDRARASLIEKALNECGYIIAPSSTRAQILELSSLTADQVSALPAWAVSRFCDIQQCADAEIPAARDSKP